MNAVPRLVKHIGDEMSKIVKQAWYTEHRQEVMLNPGVTYTIKLDMHKEAVQTPQDAAQLRIVAYPERAAVFVDEQFTGHVNEFNGSDREFC